MDELTAFVEVSVLLTGLDEILSNPDPKDNRLSQSMAEVYLRRLKGASPAQAAPPAVPQPVPPAAPAAFSERLHNLLAAYQKLASAIPKPPLDNALLTKLRADPAFDKFVAMQIVNIWYFSQFRIKENDPGAPFFDGGFFERGFVWDVIKAHPTGFSDQPHGYWTKKP